MRLVVLRSQLFVRQLLLLCLWIAAGSQAGVAQSQISWSFAGPQAASDRILALAADPRNDSVVYLAAPGGGVWKSEDGGEHWTPRSDSGPTLQVCSLAVNPDSPEVVYLGMGDDQSPRPAQGVGRSSDGGTTWTYLARLTDQPICALAVDPKNSARVVAGSAEGLFLSLDAGSSWNQILGSTVTSAAFDVDGTIYAGLIGEDVLVSSSDNGHSWNKLVLPPNPNATDARVNWVSVIANAGAISVVVSYTESTLDFHRSTDAGNSWTSAFSIGRAHPPISLLSDSVTGNLYVVADTLQVSMDQGSTWATIRTTTGEFHTGVLTGGMILLGGEKGLESVTLTEGASPRSIPQLPLGHFTGVAFDSENRIWAAGSNGLLGLYAQGNFTDVRSPVTGAVGSVAATTGSTDIFAAGNSRIYRSTDGGLRFSSGAIVDEAELRAPYPPVIIDPVNTSTAFVAGQRIYRTTNNGTSWTPLSIVSPDPTHVVIALANSTASRTVLYAATACLPEVALVSCPVISLIWRSTNGGQSWTQASAVSGLVNRLAVDPRQTNTLYAAIGAFPGGPSLTAGLTSGDLLQSTNGGTAWTSVHGNLPPVPVNTVVIDSTSLPALLNLPAQTLYVGTDAGVYVTFNAGVRWTDISGGPSSDQSLPPIPITDLALRPSDKTLAAATFGRGVYQASVQGLTPGITLGSLTVDVTLTQGTTITTAVNLTNASATTTLGWLLIPLDPWISVVERNGSLRPSGSLQAALRISASDLQLGNYLGRVQLISGAFVQTVFIDAHVTASPAEITILSGNNPTGAAGAALPLKVMISDANKLPLPAVPVKFSISAGGGSLSAGSVTTNAAGLASTVLTLPATAGAVTVLITSGEISASLTATVIPAPTVQPDSIVDGVTFNIYTSLGPGSVISISGQNLAEGTAVAGNTALPTSLLSTRVIITTTSGDVALPLFSVSSAQVRAHLPPQVLPGVYRLRVEMTSRRSNEVLISVAAFAPGIFTTSGNGRGAGLFVKPDGSAVTAANPAERGSIVTFYASGLGAVNGSNTVAAPRVFFDIYQAEVISSSLAPNLAGRYQVTVRVPLLVSIATNISVSLTIGGYTSNRVTIPVR